MAALSPERFPILGTPTTWTPGTNSLQPRDNVPMARICAAWAHLAANRDEKLPRKPLPATPPTRPATHWGEDFGLQASGFWFGSSASCRSPESGA
jgi:hypothetical protein